MAIQQKKPHTVGIKELKDQASSIIQSVEKTGRPVVVTKNNREVARIIPIQETVDPMQRLRESGRISREGTQRWKELKLIPIGIDATEAIQAIISDREDG